MRKILLTFVFVTLFNIDAFAAPTEEETQCAHYFSLAESIKVIDDATKRERDSYRRMADYYRILNNNRSQQDRDDRIDDKARVMFYVGMELSAREDKIKAKEKQLEEKEKELLAREAKIKEREAKIK